MKIIVKAINKIEDNFEVCFETDIGEGIAIWKSLSDNPIIGNMYDAEFDVDDSIKIGKTAIHSDNHSYKLSYENSIIQLNGLVDSIDDDGMTYFRLGKDCLIMIESEIGKINTDEWLLLKFNVSDFEVTVQ